MIADYSINTLAYLWLGALAVGLGKGGVPGIGNITAPLFAIVCTSSRESVGVLLPVLIAGDIVAVLVYRRHAEWLIVARLFPWIAPGVVVGALAINHMDDAAVRLFLGWLMLLLAFLELLRRWLQSNFRENNSPLAGNRIYSTTAGFFLGFTSMVANAAGPIGQIYLLSTGLPKMAFIGTAAWLFMLMNWFKLPFMLGTGVMTVSTLQLSVLVAPAAVLGGITGPFIAKRIPQDIFIGMVWLFVVITGLKLII